MSRNKKKELCNYCKYHHQEYTGFDGGVIYLTVDRCKKGHNIHSPELECFDFECKLKYKIKNMFVRW